MKSNKIYNIETTVKGSIDYNDRVVETEKKKEYYRLRRDIRDVMLEDIRRGRSRK